MPDDGQDPFEQLRREHRTIEARVADLDRAADATADAEQRESALATIADVLDYFEGPAALHHADEADTLFPLLGHYEQFTQMLTAFEFQHQMNDSTQAELRAAFGAYTPDGGSSLPELAHRFAEMQRAHIMAEERALLPLAAATLSSQHVQQMREEMAARRRR